MYICVNIVANEAFERPVNLINNVLEYAMTAYNLTQSRLKEVLSFNPETGIFWFHRTNKWMVYIGTGKNKEHLGYFIDFFEAVFIRKSDENRLCYHKNHGSVR